MSDTVNKEIDKRHRCFIFGALNAGYMPEKPTVGDLVIAADKGYDVAVSKGIKPDITVGDFDSRGSAPDTDNLITLKVRKDDTDVGHAVETGFERGCSDFVVYGAVGGLLDHTLANIVIARDIVEKGGSALFIGDEYSFTVIKNSSFRFDKRDRGRISVFSLSEVAVGVNIKGLSYEADELSLSCNSHMGVSNSFIGEEAVISVSDGILLIVWQSE